MLKTIIQKELKAILRSPKFTSTFVLCTVLILLSVFTGIKEYQTAREDLEAELKERTQNMEDKIHDQMLEGGWDEAFEGFVGDLVTLKAGVIKGPIARLKKQKEYIQKKQKIVLVNLTLLKVSIH